MAAQASTDTGMKPTLGLTGVTINAMALIAPGAFLWTTFQSQAGTGATSMWSSVFVATVIALLTALAYAALAKRYPEAGTGSSYYFAEVAVLHKEEHKYFKFARLSKFLVGWASHLYYWVYPGVMVAFMGSVIAYIIGFFVPGFGTPVQLITICIVFSIIVGAIAYIGVTGSTVANIVINIIQILALLVFSIVAIVFRLNHPFYHYAHPSALSVLIPHDGNGFIYQSTIAILLVVGFESATALAAEAKNPQRDVPRGVLLSLIIQAVIFYFFEYFAANFVMGDFYKSGKTVGFDAAAGSIAPIGDLAQIFGGSSFGTAFAAILAVSVVIALLGTALSCLNTGVRVTYAMGKDTELPAVFGFLHGRFRTPHVGVIVLTVISAVIGSYGVLSSNNLVQVALISNIGTFILYGLTCIVCLIAFAGMPKRGILNTLIAPIAGAILNVAMLLGVIYFAIVGNSDAQRNVIIAGIFAIAWLVIGFAFLFFRKVTKGIPILHAEDYKQNVGITPEVSVGTASGE
ncbi:APC family permease [Dictyobacter arantiisoli]|uniref:Amino acid permease n=1 Tax=Dictyobacter arantiisoli TaxID=2014874 RepID=A0A5A5TAS8_9CHLR|nr:APC family permease [Dictyobacter arantiisoli]GCF08532.1 amino acid permease [Dictyobacter arantiisoli]